MERTLRGQVEDASWLFFTRKENKPYFSFTLLRRSFGRNGNKLSDGVERQAEQTLLPFPVGSVLGYWANQINADAGWQGGGFRLNLKQNGSREKPRGFESYSELSCGYVKDMTRISTLRRTEQCLTVCSHSVALVPPPSLRSKGEHVHIVDVPSPREWQRFNRPPPLEPRSACLPGRFVARSCSRAGRTNIPILFIQGLSPGFQMKVKLCVWFSVWRGFEGNADVSFTGKVLQKLACRRVCVLWKSDILIRVMFWWWEGYNVCVATHIYIYLDVFPKWDSIFLNENGFILASRLTRTYIPGTCKFNVIRYVKPR